MVRVFVLFAVAAIVRRVAVGQVQPKAVVGEIEIEAKFFEIPESVAKRLGLVRMPGTKAEAGSGQAAEGQPEMAALYPIMAPAAVTQLLERLDAAKGVDLLSAPRVTTRSGQRAVIEIIREYRYPAAFDFDKETGAFVPTSIETRNLGVTLEAEPVIVDDTIDLQLAPQVVELEGFVRAKDGQPVPLRHGPVAADRKVNDFAAVDFPKDTVLQPVFSTRKVTTSVNLSSGESVILGGMKRNPEQGKSSSSRILYVLVSAQFVGRSPKNLAPLPVLPVAVLDPADEPGFVRSPFAPDAKPIDARGLPSGTELKCPTTRNLFRVR